MTNFIRLLTTGKLSQDIITEFAAIVSQNSSSDLFESNGNSAVININMYETINKNVLEIPLKKELSDNAASKIFKQLQLEDFELETNLNEGRNDNLIVIYPGRFQIWHKGHCAVLNHLSKQFTNADVFVATSDKTDNAKSPFTFEEKIAMMKLTGVDTTRVIQTVQPYVANEIISNYNPSNTVVLYIVSEKDSQRFKFPKSGSSMKQNGEPAHMQKWVGLDNALPVSKHSYIGTTKTVTFSILGKEINSATQMREMFSTLDNNTQKQFIIDAFGKYSKQVHKILKNKL